MIINVRSPSTPSQAINPTPVSWVLLKYCNVMFSVFQNTMCLSNPLKAFTVAYVTFRNATYTASTHIGLE